MPPYKLAMPRVGRVVWDGLGAETVTLTARNERIVATALDGDHYAMNGGFDILDYSGVGEAV